MPNYVAAHTEAAEHPCIVHTGHTQISYALIIH